MLKSKPSENRVAAHMADKVRVFEARCEDAENRLRHENLIFYGSFGQIVD